MRVDGFDHGSGGLLEKNSLMYNYGVTTMIL